jgi:hypothetical protein
VPVSRTRRHGAFLGLCILLSLPTVPVFGNVEWSMNVEPEEAAPKSFPTAAIHLRNTGEDDANVTVRVDAEVPLRSVSNKETVLTLRPGEETTTLHTLYVPPEAKGGSQPGVRVAVGGVTRSRSLRIREAGGFKARALSAETFFLSPGGKAAYQIHLENFGNVPLEFELHATTSPAAGRSRAIPEHFRLGSGATAEASIEIEADKEITSFTDLVTIVEVKVPGATDGHESEFLYFHTEVFPPDVAIERAQLYETLKGSIRLGTGAGYGNSDHDQRDEALFRGELSLEGMIAEQTRLELAASGMIPSQGKNGAYSSALSSLPGSSLRNFFHLGILHPQFDVEAGEFSTAPPRLLSSRETGDGLRVAYRPGPGWQIETFVERNTLTLTDKTVFGAMLGRTVSTGSLEFWRIGTLGKRGDVGPQGRNWNAAALESGWRLPGRFPLRAELSGAFGRNNDGNSGSAWLAGLHYNRTLPGETDLSPIKAGGEFATGAKGFPGIQNGREDRRAYFSVRLSSTPSYSEAYFNFNDSEYKVVPRIEKTLAEELDAKPNFLHTSQSRLLNGGVRWKNLAESKSRLPSGSLEFQEMNFFNDDNFFDRSKEKAVALTVQPLDAFREQQTPDNWDLNLLTRAGTEDHEDGSGSARDSRFVTFGIDAHRYQPAPPWLERLDAQGVLSFDFSARYTFNLDHDSHAFNRNGLTTTTATVWQTRNWNAKAAASVYQYQGESLSLRAAASVTRRVTKDWWAGIEGAFVHRGTSSPETESPDESAVFLTFRHDFDLAVPWLPRRGQSTGVIFDDLNNNGLRDTDEPGLAGIKVGVGRALALTGADGRFTLPPMESGEFPLAITPPSDLPLNQREMGAVDQVKLKRGQVTTLAIGMIKPTACEGRVRIDREDASTLETVKGVNGPEENADLSGIEIVATDKAGLIHRSFTRADGFFAIYLEPGAYALTINPATLKSQQSAAPSQRSIEVKRERLENLDFTVTEKVRRIRKTFTAKAAQNP